MAQQITAFGKAVKIRLVELGQTQAWLVQQVGERTGDAFDQSYLHRILRGKLSAERGYNGNPGKAQLIREILGLCEDDPLPESSDGKEAGHVQLSSRQAEAAGVS